VNIFVLFFQALPALVQLDESRVQVELHRVLSVQQRPLDLLLVQQTVQMVAAEQSVLQIQVTVAVEVERRRYEVLVLRV